MTSSYGRRYFEFTAKQTTNLASTNSTTLGNFPLLLPSTKEQEQLVKHLNQKTTELDDALHYMQHQIDLVREYRTRLIADVVTGKLDVRKVKCEGGRVKGEG
jgi:type I restriction enzyme S subunit